MKKLIVFLAMIFVINLGWSQSKEPNSIPEKEVRKKVIQKFKEKHSEVVDAVWYPYPNRYWKNQESVTPVYYNTLGLNNDPDYYEVRFSDENGKVRKVYERDGTWKITSRPITEVALPQEISTQLAKKELSNWTKTNYEKISKSGVVGSFYKVWLVNEKKKRILYFDNENELVKTLKFDNDLKLTNTTKNTPRSAKSSKITTSEVPASIRTKAKKNHNDAEIIEWVMYTRIYDPFQTGNVRSYYDLELPAYYQVLFKIKSKKFVATYNSYAELLEVSQTIITKDLPKAVKKTLKSKPYSSWILDKEQDKLKTENGLIIYKIYGLENKELRMLILNKSGEVVVF